MSGAGGGSIGREEPMSDGSWSQRKLVHDESALPSFDLLQFPVQFLQRALSRLSNPDAIAYGLARRTPRVTSLSLILLLAGMVASRIELWVEGFLWGIPALGAASLGPGLVLWLVILAWHPGLSAAARRVLRRAMIIQLLMAPAALIGLIYFVGMALRVW
jgi:hypothetical protein